MKLHSSEELAIEVNLNLPGGTLIAGALTQIFKYNKLNKVYSQLSERAQGEGLRAQGKKIWGVSYEVWGKWLQGAGEPGPRGIIVS